MCENIQYNFESEDQEGILAYSLSTYILKL